MEILWWNELSSQAHSKWRSSHERCGLCSVVTLGDLRGSMSDVDISGSSRPASSSSSLDMCGPDQQQPAQAKAAAQAATMVMLVGYCCMTQGMHDVCKSPLPV